MYVCVRVWVCVCVCVCVFVCVCGVNPTFQICSVYEVVGMLRGRAASERHDYPETLHGSDFFLSKNRIHSLRALSPLQASYLCMISFLDKIENMNKKMWGMY